MKTRERFEKMEGAPRLLLHGVVWGKAQSPAESAEHMRRLVEVHQIQAFKLYPVWSPDGEGYRMDAPGRPSPGAGAVTGGTARSVCGRWPRRPDLAKVSV